MISRAEFERARALIHRSGVAETIERKLRAGRGGRPRALTCEVLLTALLLTHRRTHSLMLAEVHRTLTAELPRRLQCDLGVRRSDGSALSVRQVRYLMGAIAGAYAYTHQPALDEHEQTRRRNEFQALIDDLLEASLPTGHARTGRYAIDATAIDSAARGKRSGKDDPRALGSANVDEATTTSEFRRKVNREATERASHDPDAEWGYRTRTFDNRSSMCFGYQMLALTRVGATGQSTPEPLVTERIVVIPANATQPPSVIAAIDRLRELAHPVVEVIADRGFTYATPENWAAQLRTRSIAQVLDLHAHDHGVTDYKGVKMIAGWPHCPAMPTELDDIRRPANLSPGARPRKQAPEKVAAYERRVAQIAEFKAKIAARELYAFARVSRGRTVTETGKGGIERFACPAQAGKIKCPNCPLSMAIPGDIPTITDPPDKETGAAPPACHQRTISVPPSVSPKLRQQHRWGSDEWIASYARRSRVESSFGLLKSPKHGGVKRGWTQQVGIVKTTLLLAIAVASTNLHQLLLWSRETGNTCDPLTRMSVPEAAFEEIGPAEGAGGAASPPA